MAKKLISLLTVTEITVLVVLCTTHLSNCHPDIKTLCVHAVDDSTECSALTQSLNCSVCQLLSFYIQNVNKYFNSNVRMVFTMGNHCLPLPPDGAPVINVTGVSNFTMKGLGNVSYNPSEEGAIQPSSVITCSCSQNKSGIMFYKSSAIHIESLTIEDCGTEVVVPNPPKTDFTTESALIFSDSCDIELVKMRMNRNIEYGIFAEQVYGNFTISNSAFLRCVAIPLKKKTDIGSNAWLTYRENHPTAKERTSLLIEHSWFLYGGNKSKTAAGLSLFIYRPKVSVRIDHTKVMYNTGGNVVIHVDDYHENTSSVTVNNSIIAHGSAGQGGGLNIRVEATQLWQNGSNVYANTSLNVVAILKTRFMNNLASDRGGGVFIDQYEMSITNTIQRQVSFTECQFIGNSVIQGHSLGDGAAVHIYKHEIPDIALHINPLFSFFFINCTFKYNKLNYETKEGGITTFISTNSIIMKDSNFTSNEGTAIFLQNSNVQFSGSIIFMNNSALHGGALSLCQSSKMYLPVGNIHIDFINNSATSTGGAIDVREDCTERIPPCFFQPGYQMDVKFSELNATLRFVNNVATLAGDAIYGGQVDRCYMITYNNNFIFEKIMYHSQGTFNKIFNLTQQNNITRSTISSSPFGACFCNATESENFIDTLNCSNMTYHRAVIPGETISIGAAAVGQRNGTVPISSASFEFSNTIEDKSVTTKLVLNNTFQERSRTRCNILTCVVYSNETSGTFKLAIQQTNPIETTYAHYKPPYLTILIKECPWGFILSNSPPYKCICDNIIASFGISCTVDTQTVTVPGRHYYWVGCSRSSGSNCRGLSLAVRCLLGYCKTETISISPATLDQQCSDGREGVLCGHCKPNYSLALGAGTSRCLPKCPGYHFYIILVVFVASGILLILFLIACNFTVNEGTINGLFFYANVVHKNSDSFFPGSKRNFNTFRLFITWLNLDLGLEVCFYRSMTQYHKFWIQCGFLFYLCILEVTIIILSRKYIFFARLFGRNVVKVLATLFLICCAKMIDIGISSLEFAHIRHSDGPGTVVWLFDGNISYLKGKHIPLFVLGLIFCSLALVYTMILLFIQCLQRRSNICCLRWVERWRPFFEAYTSPCRIKYRFWPGFLFFIRLILFMFGSVLRDKPTVNLHITTAACVVILIFAFVSPSGVYKHWPLNVLEFSFLVNLGILSTLVATFSHSSGPHASSFVYPSVAIAMIFFACIVLYHCMKKLTCFQRSVQSVATRKANFRGLKRFTVWKEVEQEEEAEPFLMQRGTGVSGP